MYVHYMYACCPHQQYSVQFVDEYDTACLPGICLFRALTDKLRV